MKPHGFQLANRAKVLLDPDPPPDARHLAWSYEWRETIIYWFLWRDTDPLTVGVPEEAVELGAGRGTSSTRRGCAITHF